MAVAPTRHRLLVIDDSADFQILIKTYLQNTEFATLPAGDGLQATGLALRERPRLILLDIGLPGGNGLLLLDRLHANTHTGAIPIIVATGDRTDAMEAAVRAKGVAGYLRKPIDKQVLLDTLRQALQPSTSTTAPRR